MAPLLTIKEALTNVALEACTKAVRRTPLGEEISARHLLAALLDQPYSSAQWIIGHLSIDAAAWRDSVERDLKLLSGLTVESGPALRPRFGVPLPSTGKEKQPRLWAAGLAPDLERLVYKVVERGSRIYTIKVTTAELLHDLVEITDSCPPGRTNLKAEILTIINNQAAPVLNQERNGELVGESPNSCRTPKQIKEWLDRTVVGQDVAKMTLAVAVHDHLRPIRGKAAGNTILLLGPTGCGKTWLVQRVAELLNKPYTVVDSSNLTSAGMWGDDVEDALRTIYMNAKNDLARAQDGLIFFDEIDKLAIVQGSRSNLPEYHKEVQSNLLRFIEGNIYHVRTTNARNADTVSFSTHGLFIILGGAFQGLDKLVSQRTQGPVKSIGFTNKNHANGGGRKPVIPQQPISDDVVAYGMLPEFVGRMTHFVSLEPLGTEQLESLLQGNQEGSAGTEVRRWFADYNVTLTLEPDAVKELARAAAQMGTGARGLRYQLESVLTEVKFELPSRPEVTEVVVTLESVLDSGVLPRLLTW